MRTRVFARTRSRTLRDWTVRLKLVTGSVISALLISGALVSPLAHAATEASTVIRRYDDSKTQVLSPSLEVTSTFNEDRMTLSFEHTQDLLTSASSEVKTYASQGKITDHRKEFGLNFSSLIPDGNISFGVITSDEEDYNSRIVVAGGTREFFQKNTTVGFGFATGADVIRANGNPTFIEGMSHQIYSISLAQILSKQAIFQILYDFRVENGYIASAYRRAKLISGSSVVALSENHPRTRNRHAVGFKYNYFSNALKTSFATAYRVYQDSWGVMSHTIEERISYEFSRKFEIATTMRYYTQNKAKFHKDYYVGDPGPFYTGNNTLGTYNSINLGLRPSWNITDKLNVSAKFEAYQQRFQDVTAANRLETLDDDEKLKIDAFVVGLGMTAKF